MSFEKRSYSVLIISGSEKGLDYIGNILPMELFYPTVSLTNAAEGRRLMLEQDFDIVIINTPLKDEMGAQLAMQTAERADTAVMMLCKAEVFDQMAYKVEDYGVFCVPKPISKERLLQTMRLMTATHARLERLSREKDSMKSKLEEFRIVNRAKWVLIENEDFSEAEAHRYIEKQAMDKCVHKRIIAEEIIKTYEL